MHFSTFISFVTIACLCLAQQSHGNSSGCPTATSSVPLPTVDLGYALHRAVAYNETGAYYNFSNIRYAQNPIGALRWTLPQPPLTNRSTVNDGGDFSPICPQASPGWNQVTNLLAQGKLNFTAPPINYTGGPIPDPDPSETEDCLFLDVMVPKAIFDGAGHGGEGAPVMVWIYGGGYVAGSKTAYGSPAGIISRASDDGEPGQSKGIIYVALNYRVGGLGFLAGPTLQSNGTANVGFHDQRLALSWVQSHIASFGGDPSRVTVFGESAGAGSIMHHITAYGGAGGPLPFQQAILQSPAWQPITSNYAMEQTFLKYLSAMGVSSIEEARSLDTMVVRNASARLIIDSPYSTLTFGPVVDGDYVPGLPGKLLLQGAFDHNLKLMIGHNEDEGFTFSNPYLQTNDQLTAFVASSFPQAAPQTVDYIVNTLYPAAAFAPLGPFISAFARTDLMVSEFGFTCNTNYLARAFNNETYSYYYAIPPGWHGLDASYTFWNGESKNAVEDLSPTIAKIFQEYLTDFAIYGSPNGGAGMAATVPVFNMYGVNASVLDVNITNSFQMIPDTVANARCAWWQKALYS